MNNHSDKIVAIIQARMGSTRLPDKVLMEIDGVPLLEIMLSRVAKSELLDKVIIATSTLPNDEQIEEFCQKYGYECFRGSENDVLSRYYECATIYHAEVIVRLTADCPLIDPVIIDKVINHYFSKNVDYAANTVPPETSTFPDGSDVEVFSFKALERAHGEASDPKDREHVTFYFWKYNHGFSTAQLTQDKDWSNYRITVDYSEDIEVIRFLVLELKKNGSFGNMGEIIQLLDNNASVFKINSSYTFGQGW